MTPSLTNHLNTMEKQEQQKEGLGVTPAKVIEGYAANRSGEWQFDIAPDENDNWQISTLIIGDRGIAKGNVMAMLDDFKKVRIICDMTYTERQAFVSILAKYGITL